MVLANRRLALQLTFQSGLLMVNMEYSEDAIKLSSDHGFFENVGLHLNFAEGFPLSEDIKKEAIFCNEDGRFNGSIWN